MEQSAKPPATSALIPSAEDTTPGRYTCYDTAAFLALYIVLSTTGTVDAASDAFEQGEEASQAHQHIEITESHHRLARRPSRRTAADEDRARQKKRQRTRSRIANWLEEVVGGLKAE